MTKWPINIFPVLRFEWREFPHHDRCRDATMDVLGIVALLVTLLVFFPNTSVC